MSEVYFVEITLEMAEEFLENLKDPKSNWSDWRRKELTMVLEVIIANCRRNHWPMEMAEEWLEHLKDSRVDGGAERITIGQIVGLEEHHTTGATGGAPLPPRFIVEIFLPDAAPELRIGDWIELSWPGDPPRRRGCCER